LPLFFYNIGSHRLNDIENNGIAVNDQLGVFVTDIIGGTPGGGIYRSLDNGNSWQKVINLSANSIMVANDQSIYSSVYYEPYHSGILNSSDDGSTWLDISSGLDLEKTIISFTQDKLGYVYAGSYGGGLYRSRNPITEISKEYKDIISGLSLSQNYPNPFNPSTKISWQSPVGSWQTLKVYDILGKEVATLVNEEKPAGIFNVDFNASHLASGIYYYQLKVGGFIETKKMILLR